MAFDFMKKNIIASIAALGLSACTSINVDQLHDSTKVTKICIEENPKVFSGFLPTVERMINDKGYQTQKFSSNKPEGCDLIMRYTARRSWDVTTYLSLAEVDLFDMEGFKVASADYRHKGGLGFNKWASVETKMTPVIDELLPQRQRN